MTFDTHHRIAFMKLVTVDGTELELAPDIEWHVTLWRMHDWRSTNDRQIEMGTVIERGDADIREASQAPAAALLREAESHASLAP